MSIVTKEVKVQARVVPEVRDRATAVLQSHGFTMSEFIRTVVTSVADGNLPEDFLEPNEGVMASLMEVADDLNGSKKLPVAHSREELERGLNDE
ncbi:MAG TPA: damage-inducible protein J [Lactobacillus sp.]|nr:damage-inducible protein J [Lactobacillus sp.]